MKMEIQRGEPMSEPTVREMLDGLYKNWACHPNHKRVDFNLYQAIYHLIEHRPKVIRERIKEWADKNLPLCSCDEMYKSRNLIAPDCLLHNGLQLDDLIDFARLLGVGVSDDKD